MRILPSLILTLSSLAPCFAIPVTFEQRDPAYFAVHFTDTAAELHPDHIRMGGVTFRFVNAAREARMEGLGAAAPGTYFQAATRRTLAQFPRLAIRNLYPGIDAVFHGNEGHLEYDLEIAAGVPADRVRIRLEGSRGIRIDAAGDLMVETASGLIRQTLPAVFQSGRAVPARYVLLGANDVGIRLGKHDRRLPLTIDPVLASVKNFGGSGTSLPSAIATDSQGNIYVAGQSNSIDFPTTVNGFQPRIAPPLLVLSNAGQTMTRVPVATEDSVLAVGGTPDGKILYAQGAGGMYLSVDSGATWRKITSLPPPVGANPNAQTANGISVDAIDPSKVFVATNTGLYSSSDAGGSWAIRDTNLPVSASSYVSVASVFINPNDHLIAYAVTNSNYFLLPNQLFKSVDAGNTWVQLNPSYPGEPPVQSPPAFNIVATPALNGNDLYVINGNATLVKTADGGATWQKLASQLVRSTALVIDPSNAANLYVLDYAGVQKSSDGGLTFTTVVAAPPPGTASGIQAKSIAVDSSGALYVSSQNQIFVSADGGATLKPLPQFLSAQTLTAVGGNVFVGLATPLIPFVVKLDPSGSQILYSTFLGGTFQDGITAIAVDTQGNAVLTGYAISPDFPVTIPAASPPSAAKSDGFVAKLSADGTRLIFSTLLGASKFVSPSAVAVDSSGAVYITGQTSAADFPTTAGVIQSSLPAARCTRPGDVPFIYSDTGRYAFLTKLRADGSALVYSTFLTGACGSAAASLAVGPTGEAVVAGYTTSPDFPVSSSAYQTVFPGQPNQPTPPNPLYVGFVTKLSSAADKVIASTLLGSGFATSANSVMLDSTGSTYVTGSTQGIAQGTTPGAYQSKVVDLCVPTINIGPGPPYTGTRDAFVLKLDPAFSTSQVLSYFGGTCNDSGSQIAVDATGNIWLTGFTQSQDFPLLSPFQGGGISGGFVSELSPDASKLLFSSLSDGSVMTLGPQGAVYIAGTSGNSVALARIDPSTTPSVIIDSVAPVVSFPPSATDPFLPGVAPGLLIRISGRNLGPATKLNAQLDSTGHLPFELAGTVVFFDNIPAPLISVQDSSIVCFVPFEVTRITKISAVVNGQRSNSVRTGVAGSAAQILSIANQDGTPNSADNPAKEGSVLTLYVSGLGRTDPPSADGLVNSAPLAVPAAPVMVYLPGMEIEPQFVGAAPGLIAGISQVNVQLPAGISNPTKQVRIAVSSVSAPFYVTP